MKTFRMLDAFVLMLLALGISYGYSGVRSMQETTGFHFSASAGAILISFFLLAPLLIGFLLFRRKYLHRRALATFAVTALIGVFVAEFAILADEHRFQTEASAAESNGKEVYSRDRAWPNNGTSLVWNRGHGIHAVD